MSWLSTVGSKPGCQTELKLNRKPELNHYVQLNQNRTEPIADK